MTYFPCYRCGTRLKPREEYNLSGMEVDSTGALYPPDTYSCVFCLPAHRPNPSVPACRILMRLGRMLDILEGEYKDR